ncbi:MAG: helix-turn-helix domain-containing protein [Clostridia bacterium]|nr:helix-turn-helix domain-containing protein [Clostridia bacterium]
MEIGTLLRNARTEKGMTQEEAAYEIGVSRQTMSNWENDRTYPDIISVIKMSDLYGVSLDHLLKGEGTMDNNDYLNYLDESTNTVSAKNKVRRFLEIASYVVIWAVIIASFWLNAVNSIDAMGFSIVAFYMVLPVAAFVISIFIGANESRSDRKWLLIIFFAVMHMMAEYVTFSLANMIYAKHFNHPQWELLISGAIMSALGMAIGHLVLRHRRKKASALLNGTEERSE